MTYYGYAVVVGAAFEASPDYPTDSPYLRLYRKCGHTYVGYSTLDELYFCTAKCVKEHFKNWMLTDDGRAYLVPSENDDEMLTADVQDEFDWDETVQCEVCKNLVVFN